MKFIYNTNRWTLVFLITLLSLALSLLLDSIIASVLNHSTIQKEDYVRVGLIPLLITPFISWFFIGLLLDVVKLEKKMTHLATFDDLTGMYNRRFFYSLGKQVHQYALRNKSHYAILVIDFDSFKNINDNYGHECGDRVLEAFGFVANKTARDSDILARIGGEEFAFLLPNTNANQAQIFAQRLLDKINQSVISYNKKSITYSVSIGVAINFCDHEFNMEETLKKADIALYQAKENGKNTVQVFEKGLKTI